jgi:hypothetical protein
VHAKIVVVNSGSERRALHSSLVVIVARALWSCISLSFLQQLSQQSRRCLLFLLMAVVGSLLCLAIIFVCAVGENEGGGGAVVVLVAMALGHRAPRWAVVVGGCCERRSKTCRVVRTRRAAWLTPCVFVCWGWGGGGGVICGVVLQLCLTRVRAELRVVPQGAQC